ncbi:MAG: GntR family transcriptional regulator / MocR family aminotransferase [Candidatus Eremiobacteraeota bacterium]|nr:GntR family transcriptional regulator / MocR family aminotransferase [Candidatus Eremiobacteraeota bacterium]
MSFFPDRTSAVALHRQLATHLRDAVLGGELAGGTRLHASRALAEQLGVSRNTVTQAIDELVSEGYLETRVGAGTYVASGLTLRARGTSTAEAVAPRLSVRARRFAPHLHDPDGGSEPALFRPGVPDLALFPDAVWRRVANRWLDGTSTRGYGDPHGYRPLRDAIATHLRQTRGVTVGADNVIVVEGTRAALALIADVLLDPGDAVAVEDPGYAAMHDALSAAGALGIAVPLDDEGFDVTRAPPDARLAYVTPSHQYPTGVVMGLRRRLDLLDWARAANAYVVEDDYDAEFRYDGAPLPALQGLDASTGSAQAARVLYVGTFSKTLAPGLRVAWIVVPDALADAFGAARAVASGGPSFPLQAALAAFVADGHFALHVRRASARYRERRDALVGALEHRFGNAVRVQGAATGLHVVARFDGDDLAVTRAAAEHDVVAPALSRYALDGHGATGLVLGFAAGSPNEIEHAAERLERAFVQTRQPSRTPEPS